MRRTLLTAPIALVLAGCVGAASAPPLATVPAQAQADPVDLAACREVSVLLNRRVNFLPPLLDFLDDVRESGCAYTTFRVDTRSLLPFSTNMARAEALDTVRSYRASYSMDWTAERVMEDARIPRDHIRVLFLTADAPADLDESV